MNAVASPAPKHCVPPHAWDKPGIPHRGWSLIGVEDHEDGGWTCQMCGKQDIRYVHQVAHPEHGDLFVGCVCAEHMTGDYVNPRKREQRLRNLAARRARWLSRAWRVSSKGNQYLNLEGRNVGVLPDQYRPGRWKWRVGRQFSSLGYPTADAAKLALFDELIARRKPVPSS